MNTRNVVIPTRAAQELAGLPHEVRMYVQAYLENLDVLLLTAPVERISMLWQRAPDEGGGFVADVEGARVFFSADTASGTVTVRRIEHQAGSPA